MPILTKVREAPPGSGRCGRALRRSGLLLVAVALCGEAALPQYNRAPLRTLAGTVTAGREPIRGAVVQIEAEDTMVIQSYVTDERGIYHFRNLRPDADFRVWATFRGHKSKTHEMSKFDRKADREIALDIDLTRE